MERLIRELNFDTRQEQSTIARQSPLYRNPQIERFIEQEEAERAGP
jgi:hypothetical protein